MNKLLLNVYVWGIILLTTSCVDITVDESGVDMDVSRFNGTIYEYLQQGDNRLGVTFDSLLYLLEYTDETNSNSPLKFQDLKACLQDVQGEYTLFAAPDSCFSNALKSLNRYRRLNGLTDSDGDLTLKKLLDYRKEIDRYSASDPTLVVRTDVYEYKTQLDSLVCRYVISGNHDTKSFDEVSGSSLIVSSIFYNYRMYVSYQRQAASGFEGAGLREITYYDMLNTLQKDEWIGTKMISIDILCSNGVVHLITPAHEFGYGQCIQSFKNYGHEE
ncbi:MAG: hypothetical protein LBS20_09575 [Prevotella sp.]|jgi:hypothetical protein|nr:hypothetical protein [Prevotella sp.]